MCASATAGSTVTIASPTRKEWNSHACDWWIIYFLRLCAFFMLCGGSWRWWWWSVECENVFSSASNVWQKKKVFSAFFLPPITRLWFYFISCARFFLKLCNKNRSKSHVSRVESCNEEKREKLSDAICRSWANLAHRFFWWLSNQRKRRKKHDRWNIEVISLPNRNKNFSSDKVPPLNGKAIDDKW